MSILFRYGLLLEGGDEVTDLSLSVSDSVGLAETTAGLVGDLVCSVEDSVTVTKVTSVALAVLGSICWGHDTGVEESNKKNFQDNWTGTGSIGGSDDEEALEIESGNYMESENMQLGTGCVLISINKYRSGTGVPVKKYKTAGTSGDLAGAAWLAYSDQFYCEGWAKIRLEVA